MQDGFHESLWRSWLTDVLNWTLLDFENHDLPLLESKWETEQEWFLQDPARFYYPLFGLGEIDSQIAVIGVGPGQNIESPWESCSEGSYRECVRGPFKNHQLWLAKDEPHKSNYETLYDDQKDEWEEKRIHSDQERTMEGELPGQTPYYRRMAQLAPDGEFKSLYYTNFMKDGEFTKQNRVSLETVRESTAVVDEGKFDEFLNSPTSHPLYSDRWEITLSTNPSDDLVKACEIMSREFWLPFLAVELAIVDPDVVVPLGEKATRAVWEVYGITEQFTQITNHSLRTYPTESGPKITPSFHFSRASPVGQVKKKHTPLAEIIQKTGKQPLNAYLDLLSDQIQANI